VEAKVGIAVAVEVGELGGEAVAVSVTVIGILCELQAVKMKRKLSRIVGRNIRALRG
jgi:hypothetical protein